MKIPSGTNISLFMVLLMALVAPARGQIRVDSLFGITKVHDEYPSWSPDGTKIAFQSDRNDSNYEIYVMNNDGSDLRRITINTHLDETPVWSADGKKLLISRYVEGDNNELVIIDLDSNLEQQLTHHPLRDGHAKFSMDGNKIIFNSQRHDEGTLELKNYEIYEMNVDGSAINRKTEYFEWDTYPSFSPDGEYILWRRLLVDSAAPPKYNSEIFIMKKDGSDIKNLTNHPAFDGYPEWSPDGKRIVFASNRHGRQRDHFQLFVMNADGSGIQQITENRPGEEDVRPDWSPDGSRILFNRVTPDGTRIYIATISASPSMLFFNEVKHSNLSLGRASSRGVAWGDYNKDGYPDLLVANTMNNSNYLFENDQKGDFIQNTEGDEVTSAGWTEGAAFMDYDNDGDLDVFYTNQFGGPNQLFQNRGEEGFELTDAGSLTSTHSNATTACWCDYDLDGDIDVYIVERDGGNDGLHKNLGNGQFSREPEEEFPYNGGDGRTCAWGDTNGDGYPELFVGNFREIGAAEPTKSHNFYYLNQDGEKFIPIKDSPLTRERNLTYGSSFIDFDQDDDLDLFVTNIARSDQNQLFVNDGQGNFTNAHSAINHSPSRPSKGHTWGDFDNDGDLDLFVVNGTEGTEPEDVMNYLYLNNRAGEFEQVIGIPITSTANISAGTAWADYDNDGDLDLFIANWGSNTEPNAFYRNDLYGMNWLEIKLKGKTSNSFGIGTKARLLADIGGEKRWFTRWLLPQTGYASQNQPILHFGLNQAELIEQLQIIWPSGKEQILDNVRVNQILEIEEP